MWAIGRNMTTNEILKSVYNEFNHNPYDHGWYRNFLNFLLSPIPKSRVADISVETPLLRGGHFDDSRDIDTTVGPDFLQV